MHSRWRGWLLDLYLTLGLILGLAALFECCGPNNADRLPARAAPSSDR